MDEGIYSFTVERIVSLYNDSIILGFDISGKKIAQRIYFDNERCTQARYLLASVGILKDINGAWLTSELSNTVGKSGRCIIGKYVREDGREDNNVEAYLAPWCDEQEQWWRFCVLKNAGKRCESCGAPGFFAHHKKPKSIYPDDKYDVSNGMCLCYNCHKTWHDTYGTMAIGGPGL